MIATLAIVVHMRRDERLAHQRYNTQHEEVTKTTLVISSGEDGEISSDTIKLSIIYPEGSKPNNDKEQEPTTAELR